MFTFVTFLWRNKRASFNTVATLKAERFIKMFFKGNIHSLRFRMKCVHVYALIISYTLETSTKYQINQTLNISFFKRAELFLCLAKNGKRRLQKDLHRFYLSTQPHVCILRLNSKRLLILNACFHRKQFSAFINGSSTSPR